MTALESKLAAKIRIRDVARMSGVTLQTVHRWIKVGVNGEKLHAFKIGNRTYVTEDEFSGE